MRILKTAKCRIVSKYISYFMSLCYSIKNYRILDFKFIIRPNINYSICYPDHQMHNIYLNIFYIISTPTCFNASASSSGSLNVLIIPTYRKHRHRDYTHTTVQIVYAATRHKTSTC